MVDPVREASSGNKSDSIDGEMDELDMSYEDERQANIKNNAALMASLGLNATPAVRPHTAYVKKTTALAPSAEERTRRAARAKEAALRRAVEPTRRSSRVAGKEAKVDYTTDGAKPPPSPPAVKYDPLPRKTAPVLLDGPTYDESEAGPSRIAPMPSRAKDGVLLFEDNYRDVFTPNLTPEEMFNGGAFAGGFFCDTYSKITRESLNAADDLASLPFKPKDPARLYTNPDPDGSHNRFGVRAGQSLQEWEKAGWIWDGDPRGWAQWYLRFYYGRRCPDDDRQVRRWLKVAGPTGRFKRALMKKVHQSGGPGALEDEDIGRVVRQCLWQWGYELTPSEYEKAMAE